MTGLTKKKKKHKKKQSNAQKNYTLLSTVDGLTGTRLAHMQAFPLQHAGSRGSTYIFAYYETQHLNPITQTFLYL